ncbi:MAG: glycosyltransferase family A protein, partial [Bacillota bacterium]|nr:glycosyltransferase family A protein [Bacillota bacterium]
MRIGIVIRTYNERRHLSEVLAGVARQVVENHLVRTIVVDSGSNDGTPEIAMQADCEVLHVPKSEFSFGRSLNLGCEALDADIVAFLSGHCIPVQEDWLAKLIAPILQEKAVLTYGRQIGHSSTRFSERRIFEKYFPLESQIPQRELFCNNANAAILAPIWREYKYDETVTGLEDLHMAKRLLADGLQLAYVAEAPVVHIHQESWLRVKNRFEREAIALQ